MRAAQTCRRWRRCSRARSSTIHSPHGHGAPIACGWHKLELAHPLRPPHWYLAVLGADPSAQGRGLGSAVLAPVLEQCDRDGVGAYVESSKERNLDFYARHGFRVTAELRMVRGPQVWGMWREPRS